MNTLTKEEFGSLFKDRASKQAQVFDVLSDKGWHCRPCDYNHIKMDQIAGGGGIQGLERGTKSRPGLVIKSENKSCSKCSTLTRHDCWTGEVAYNSVAGDLPKKLKEKIAEHYEHKDSLTGTTLTPKNTIIDHRFPRLRWGADYESPADLSLTVNEIEEHYQILRNSKDNNENLRKSRACEICFDTNVRQSPLKDIVFFYAGSEEWSEEIPRTGSEAFLGCVGCGWFDMAAWKAALNAIVSE